jgi:hypothetical protein
MKTKQNQSKNELSEYLTQSTNQNELLGITNHDLTLKCSLA